MLDDCACSLIDLVANKGDTARVFIDFCEKNTFEGLIILPVIPRGVIIDTAFKTAFKALLRY
jgi:hypothetical protein